MERERARKIAGPPPFASRGYNRTLGAGRSSVALSLRVTDEEHHSTPTASDAECSRRRRRKFWRMTLWRESGGAGAKRRAAYGPARRQGDREPGPARYQRPQLQSLAALRAPVDQPVDHEHGPNSCIPPPRKATSRRQALWKALHQVKLQGVSPCGIARQLGISRNTVRKYIELTAPPINRTAKQRTQSVTLNHANGQFRWPTTAGVGYFSVGAVNLEPPSRRGCPIPLQ